MTLHTFYKTQYGVYLKHPVGLRSIFVKCIHNNPISSFPNYNIMIRLLFRAKLECYKIDGMSFLKKWLTKVKDCKHIITSISDLILINIGWRINLTNC